MFFNKRKHQLRVTGFGNGTLLELEEVPDEVFSKRMLGDGYAILLNENDIYAPVDGTVTMIFPTKHAIGIQTKDGKDILLHLGIDTVELEGQGFDILVSEGDRVSGGQKIATMDLKLIESLGKSTVSICLFTTGEKVKVLRKGIHVSSFTDDFIEIVA